MAESDTTKQSLKEKAKHELIEYGINIVYLTIVFAAFTIYRRLVLAAHDIEYTHYWVALIEAVILGKVIMIGSIFRLGRGLGAKPLIFPTVYKTLVFTLFCAVFKVVEFGIKGLFTGEGFMGGVDALLAKNSHELVANSLIVFVAFVPYFGVKELGRVMGEGTIRKLFFLRRANADRDGGLTS
ncbi:MAG: hypothetical protein IPL89_06950 [Acidobacteria bacterium]|nr:hypothetical protein [Acidobacteriota bacterium]